MQASIHGRTIELAQGDITRQQVDAIVNAANSRLAGGGGVDGAIHRAGGPAIMAETSKKYPGGCPTGSAVISGAGDLPAKYVIHAVGPVYAGGQRGEPELLTIAYLTSLKLATEHGCHSIALPALSTGAYRYPLAEAAQVAISTTNDYLRGLDGETPPALVRFVLFSDEAFAAFSVALSELRAE